MGSDCRSIQGLSFANISCETPQQDGENRRFKNYMINIYFVDHLVTFWGRSVFCDGVGNLLDPPGYHIMVRRTATAVSSLPCTQLNGDNESLFMENPPWQDGRGNSNTFIIAQIFPLNHYFFNIINAVCRCLFFIVTTSFISRCFWACNYPFLLVTKGRDN